MYVYIMYTCKNLLIHIYVYSHVCIYVCIYNHMYMLVNRKVFMYIYIYTYIYIYMYMYMIQLKYIDILITKQKKKHILTRTHTWTKMHTRTTPPPRSLSLPVSLSLTHTHRNLSNSRYSILKIPRLAKNVEVSMKKFLLRDMFMCAYVNMLKLCVKILRYLYVNIKLLVLRSREYIRGSIFPKKCILVEICINALICNMENM